MKKKSVVITIILFSVFGLCFLSVYDRKQKQKEPKEETSPIVFRLAETMSSNHPSAKAAEYFAKLVEDKSDGRIKIKLYYAGELGTPEQIIEQVQFGGIAMARVNVLELTETVSSLQHYFKPQTFDNSDLLMEWIDQNSGKLSDACQMERLMPVVWYYPDSRCFYSDDVPFNNVVDLSGMKINTTLCTIMKEAMKTLGATAVEAVTADTYQSLQSGYMDAGETTLSEFVISDYYRSINYVTLSQYINCPDVIVVSTVVLSTLEISDRQLINQCAQDTYEYQRTLVQESQDFWIKELEKSKNLFIEDEKFKTDMKALFIKENAVILSE